MKILFLALDVNIGEFAGDSVHVKELALALTKLGHKVILLAPYKQESYQEKKRLEKCQNLTIYLNKSTKYFHTVTNCGKIIKMHKPQVIYERRFSPKIGAALSTLYNIPLLVEVNGLVEEEERSMGTLKKEPSLFSLTKKKMRKRFFHKAKRIVTVTDGIRSALQEQYDIPLDKFEVVHNGANTELLKPMDQTVCKKELGLDVDNMYVCFVGNLVPWQGVETIIDSAPMVLQSFPTVKFLIVGDGIARSALESKVKTLGLSNAFVFKGSVPHTKVSLYINSSEICIAPFTKERNEITGLSPLKIFEYLACAKSIVASDVRGIRDIIAPYNCGIIVKPDDPKELAEGIIKLLSDDNLREEMGRRGKKLVEKKYTWERIASRIVDIFISVCKDSKLKWSEDHHLQTYER